MVEMRKKRMLQWAVCIAVGAIALLAGFQFLGQGREAALQRDLAGRILRFHVIANSDSEADQALKLKVKDEVLGFMQSFIREGAGLEETKESILANMNSIEERADAFLREQGSDCRVRGEIVNCYFPLKTYGDCTFPAGEYEAFCLVIGEGQGRNWWCVMYPNLCFVNEMFGVMPPKSREKLREILTEEEYGLVTGTQEKPVKIRFKFLELF